MILFYGEKMKKVDLEGKRGSDLLNDPLLNKGTAFTQKERDKLGLRGLLPPNILSQENQLTRIKESFVSKPTSLEKYIFLTALRGRNEYLFYKFVMSNMEECMPIIYTPTVGLACQRYAHIFRRPEGLFISSKDQGHIEQILNNWHYHDVRMIVVTDGERILGLGDLGANGMGIPVGKLSLYTACAGINPAQTLPVVLDVGTNNKELLADPLYIGVHEPRLRGNEYDNLVEEFFNACAKVFPKAVVQFEDFGNSNAFRMLAKYQDRACTFNDDIQGTASVAFAGIDAALQVFGKAKGAVLSDHIFMFFGAGEAGIGIGELIVEGLVREGMDKKIAMKKCWYFDSKGLVVKSRTDLSEHKKPFAQDFEFIDNLELAVTKIKPTALIGVAGVGRKFTKPIIETMAKNNSYPIIFALSNPTSQAECSAEDAYIWTAGKAIFASGSPFPAVVYENKTFTPGQGNNAYIFPGVGLGVIAVEATRVTNEMFFIAAKALSAMVSKDDLAMGRIYPSLKRIREVSLNIAVAVAENAFEKGYAQIRKPYNLRDYIESVMFDPAYVDYV